MEERALTGQTHFALDTVTAIGKLLYHYLVLAGTDKQRCLPMKLSVMFLMCCHGTLPP